MNFPHTATIRRSSQVGQQFIYNNVGTSKCFIQPLDNETSELMNLTYTQGYWGYFPYGTDIKEKDEIVWDNARYGVKGVKKHNYGNLKHYKILLENIK